MRIFEGKVFYKVEKAPWYSTGVDEEKKAKGYVKNVCLRHWKLPFGFYLAKRQYIKGISDELRSAILAAAKRYFKTEYVKLVSDYPTNFSITDMSKVNGGKTLRYYDEVYKFFTHLKKPTFTDNWQVIFDEETQKYYGYSHRGAQGFGIGDMLFTEDSSLLTEKVISKNYYTNRKYQKEFLKALKHHYKKKDHFGFEDLIKCGIMDVVPFREKGVKKIETLDEAFQAASNFASYIS